MPLLERRTRLASLLSGNPTLWFSSHFDGAKGDALFRHACALMAALGDRLGLNPKARASLRLPVNDRSDQAVAG